MQLARFEMFVEELQQRCTFPVPITSLMIYRNFSDAWFDDSGNQIKDQDFLLRLDRTFRDRNHWRERKSCETFYPVLDLDAVVVAESSSPPRKRTRDVIHRAILESLRHAMHAFDASHDGLTGVLNVKSIEAAFSDTVRSLVRSEINAGESLVDLSTKRQVCVISFDLDYFKQVNDSYGHDYGDVVLLCFANRMAAKVQALNRMHSGCSLVLGRTGGEEFLLVARGHIPESTAKEIAEALRMVIGDEVIPSENEWKNLPLDRKPKALQLPHVAERRIMVSVGISSIVSSQQKLNPRAVCASLRREADAALYRAKAGGRNTVRFFPDIRSNHGTVLEHHQGTGVVVIDIGTHVNVGPGQEFLVFHPDFTGQRPFVHHDGRSKKTLGYYPRRPSGRVVVFDAQPEIAFCTVSENHTPDIFPIGALLELIPVGSIAHLITPQAGTHAIEAVRLTKVDDFQNGLQDATKNKQIVNVMVFTLLNSSELETSRGAAFANRALAELFKALDTGYPLPASISQIGPTMLAVLTGSQPPAEQTAIAESLLAAAENQCAGLAHFGAGIYCSSPSEDDPTKGVFDPACALDLARYAASHLVLERHHPIEVFSDSTAIEVLSNQRSQGRHKEGISDYIRLKKCGVENAMFENQGALCSFEATEPDLPQALAAIRRANEIQADYPILMANLAVIEWASGHRLQAYDIYERIFTVDATYTLPDVYQPTHALSAFEKFLADPEAVSREQVQQLLREALGKPDPINVPVTNQDIEEALSILMADEVTSPGERRLPW